MRIKTPANLPNLFWPNFYLEIHFCRPDLTERQNVFDLKKKKNLKIVKVAKGVNEMAMMMASVDEGDISPCPC